MTVVHQPVTFLDHAAGTTMRPEAVEAMLPWLRERVGNPSGSHRLAREARTAIDDVREQIGDRLGMEPGGVIFTSGGTEADNLAVTGVAGRGGVVVASAVEHDAVLASVRALGANGRLLEVDACGRVDLAALELMLREHGPEVRLVSVMSANNETGLLQEITDVVSLVRDLAPNALVHTDAVQAFAWCSPVARSAGAAGPDLVSLSAHKFGGPKGVGALVVGANVQLDPVLRGGGQERERRSGTQNVAGIVAMAAAVAATDGDVGLLDRTERLRAALLAGLRSVPGVVDLLAEVPSTGRLPSILHLCIDGIDSEALLLLLEQQGVMASAGSSCASGALEPSHVLAAMGVPRSLARGALRLSLGWDSTQADVEAATAVIPSAVERLRELDPA